MFTLLFAITLIPAFLTNRNLYPRGFLFLYMKRLYFEGVFLTLLNSGSSYNIYIPAIVTSVIISALHLQYTYFRTFLMLFLVSLVLISEKIKSNGLLMPILLHMAMNVAIAGIQYLAYINYTR